MNKKINMSFNRKLENQLFENLKRFNVNASSIKRVEICKRTLEYTDDKGNIDFDRIMSEIADDIWKRNYTHVYDIDVNFDFIGFIYVSFKVLHDD